MTPIEAIVTNLMTEIDRIVDQKVETKLPEMIRALRIRETNHEEEEEEDLIDAVEVARMLGRDTSTEHSILCARKHVYNLAAQQLIPSVRLSPRRIKFSRAAIRKVINNGGLAKEIQAA